MSTDSLDLYNVQQVFQLTTPDESTMKHMYFTSGTHPKRRLSHSKFLSSLFKLKSEAIYELQQVMLHQPDRPMVVFSKKKLNSFSGEAA